MEANIHKLSDKTLREALALTEIISIFAIV